MTVAGFRANGDIRPFRFVMGEASGEDYQVIEGSSGAANARVIGIAQGGVKAFDSTLAAEANDAVLLQRGGDGVRMRVRTAGAIDAFDPVASDANGLGVQVAATTYYCAIALQNAADSGEIIDVRWQPNSP